VPFKADTYSPVGAVLLPHLLALKPRGWLEEQAMPKTAEMDGRAEANKPRAQLSSR